MRLKFHVGPYVVTVAIAKQPLIQDGEPILGCYNPNTRHVDICPKCPPKSRLRTLFHELDHVWYDVGGRRAIEHEEERAEWSAHVMESTVMDLWRQGGPGVLMSMGRVGDDPLSRRRYARALSEAGGSMASQRRECPQGHPIPAALVRVGEAEFDETVGAAVVPMVIPCPECQTVTYKRELANAHGWPTGEAVGTPRTVDGEAYRQYAELWKIEDYWQSA